MLFYLYLNKPKIQNHIVTGSLQLPISVIFVLVVVGLFKIYINEFSFVTVLPLPTFKRACFDLFEFYDLKCKTDIACELGSS